MREIELIILSGQDQSGLISGVMDILSSYGANILDLDESVIHSNIIFGILVAFPNAKDCKQLRQKLKQFVSSLNLSISFSSVDSNKYSKLAEREILPKFIVTLLARSLSAKHLSKVADVIRNNGLNIDQIKRLSGQILLEDTELNKKICLEFSLRGKLENPRKFRQTLLELSHTLGIDLALQEDNRYRRNRRIVVFDMDSTLIEAEVIDELAKLAGVSSLVENITQKAMSGELNFEKSLIDRVSLLKGLPVSALEQVAETLPLTEGAENLIRTLKLLGYKTAIISGGFSFFADILKSKLEIDYVFANNLGIANGKLTGEISGGIINAERKAELLKELSVREGIDCEQVIAVGDGANDINMLSAAGLGIAFKAKPVVIKQAEQSISQVSIDSILYLLGIADRHHSSV